MTNDNFKPIANLPKTETKIVLNDWSQPVKKSNLSSAARNKVINRSGGNYLSESQESYGPCSSSKCICHVKLGLVPLNSACPACGGTEPHQWVHSYCWGRMYISRNLRIQCMDCYMSLHWKDWSYKCERHQQAQKATDSKKFLTALNIAAGMNATDDGTISIISEIAINLIKEGRNS